MSNKHYDVAIVGGSLTARIAAALLAKNGNKVLFLRNQEAQAPAWFHSSIFLEKLLGVLGGRSCFTSPLPFQVISEQSRLTIGNDKSLEDELKREFGNYWKPASNWLTNLQHQGSQLEQLLWENGGLPWPSMKAAARFKLLCMKRKVNLAQLEVPVAETLTGLSEQAVALITDLLQGLSLRPVSDLSYARAAMLWAQALRPENLQEPDFSEILTKRFEQFHGSKAQLDDLAELDFDGTRWTGGRFKAGGSFSATTFLLGDKQWLELFKVGNDIKPFDSYAPSARRTTDLSGQLSPLLKSRVICGGKLPLRLAMEMNGGQQTALILSCPEATESSLRQQAETVLPFAKFELKDLQTPAIKITDSVKLKQKQQMLHLSCLPIRIKANLYHADRTAMLPEMGAAGAALLAWTLLKNLSGRTLPEKE